MESKSARGLEPRKTPRQARSVVTVDAVFEATIQVLLSDGVHRLTTTRVAERAGVSVGTLYQYYPNKQALLYAVLQRHLTGMAEVVERTCEQQRHQPLAVMTQRLVHAFVAAKTANVDESLALYLVAAELNAAKLVAEASERMRAATSSMLASAADASFEDLPTVTFIFLSAMTGPIRAVLEGRASPKMMRALREHLVTLCDAYLKRVALPVAAPGRGGKLRKPVPAARAR
ncbi:TetR/AcrR family transcriptional regulator [Paraburkholderia sp.]|jgi:AcrR family transcriptional regulator|uniref:TetR/AcrR family transcriptional regulator n=1 Tax=Paraburkholderia sp. TaxID=1926495 RepID=UPI002F41EFB1